MISLARPPETASGGCNIRLVGGRVVRCRCRRHRRWNCSTDAWQARGCRADGDDLLIRSCRGSWPKLSFWSWPKKRYKKAKERRPSIGMSYASSPRRPLSSSSRMIGDQICGEGLLSVSMDISLIGFGSSANTFAKLKTVFVQFRMLSRDNISRLSPMTPSNISWFLEFEIWGLFLGYHQTYTNNLSSFILKLNQ